jgi:signal transduction histidine kinase
VVDDSDHIRYANAQARLYLDLPIDEDKPTSDTFLALTRQQYHCQPQQAWTTWPEQPPFLEDREDCQSLGRDTTRYLVRPESPTAKAFWLQVDTLELPAGPDGDKIIHLRDVTAQMDMWREMWAFQTLISHKLRTPLGGVVTGLELLVEEYGITKSLDAEEAKLFEIVCQSAQRLERDVLGILEYVATPTLGQSGIGFNLSNLQPLVAQICVDLELETVTVSGQMELKGARVSLSEQAIELILRELLGNSKKFHPQQAPAIEILASVLDDKQVSIQIRDDGLTLSHEQLAQVWVPYYQGDKHFTGEVAGMGLGLPKVASLIWSAGGACRMDNREAGPGVVVELILPSSK